MMSQSYMQLQAYPVYCDLFKELVEKRAILRGY